MNAVCGARPIHHFAFIVLIFLSEVVSACLNWIIDFSLRNRLLVILVVLAMAVVGGISLRYLDIDAFPDTTPVQVQINTVAASLGPEEVDSGSLFPIEQALGGLPKITGLRSVSKFGFSQVTVIFEDGTDIYFARQVINERLSTIELAPGVEPAEGGDRLHRAGRSLSLCRDRRRRRHYATAHPFTIGTSSPSCAACGAPPRSIPGAATKSSTRCASTPTG